MDTAVRTTVTLDADLDRQLKDAMHRTGKPFKRVLNEALRRGLAQQPAKPSFAPPVWPVYHMGEPLVDLTKAGALADAWDDEVLQERRQALAAAAANQGKAQP